MPQSPVTRLAKAIKLPRRKLRCSRLPPSKLPGTLARTKERTVTNHRDTRCTTLINRPRRGRRH